MKKLLRRIHYWVNRRRAAAELAEEIEFHRSLKQEHLERSGLPAVDAAKESRKELGNTLRAREESRDVWAGLGLTTFYRTPVMRRGRSRKCLWSLPL
jgi:hypothetical protein